MRNRNITIIAFAGLVAGTPALGFDCGDYPPPPFSDYDNTTKTEAEAKADVAQIPEAEQQVGGVFSGNDSKEL